MIGARATSDGWNFSRVQVVGHIIKAQATAARAAPLGTFFGHKIR